MLEALAEQVAYALNPLMDVAVYLPIVYNPHRCADSDLARIMEMQGISSSYDGMTAEKRRRLAVIGADLRAWRGSFRAHRTVASALTGGPAVLRPWLVDRIVLDESTFNLVLLDEEDSAITVIFLIGQGSDAGDYIEAELVDRLDELAKPVLDELVLVSCYAVNGWRNGFNGWVPSVIVNSFELIASTVPDEFEGIDLGPEVSAITRPFVRSPTTMADPTADIHSVLTTVYFKTAGATAADTWEIWAFGTTLGPYLGVGDGYVVRLPVGNGFDLEFFRVVNGVYTSLGTFPVVLMDDPLFTGDYHRIDFQVSRTPTLAARVRAFVDGDPTPWFDDTGLVGTRPDGRHVYAGCYLTDFTTGRLRLSTIVSKLQE